MDRKIDISLTPDEFGLVLGGLELVEQAAEYDADFGDTPGAREKARAIRHLGQRLRRALD